MTEKQRNAVMRLEEMRMAAVVATNGFEFALIPHTNSRNSLHVVGLKVLVYIGSIAAIVVVRVRRWENGIWHS